MNSQSSLPKIGVSFCLLGGNVRYDGKNKLNATVIQLKEIGFELVGFCPEMNLGIPRPPIQLTRYDSDIRLLGVEDKNVDATNAITKYFYEQRENIKQLSGFILKDNSPSCSLREIQVFNLKNQVLQQTYNGFFAKMLQQYFPDLPTIDEIQLQQQKQKEVFLNSVFSYYKKN